MIEVTLLFIFALLPSSIGLWSIERSKRKLRQRLSSIGYDDYRQRTMYIPTMENPPRTITFIGDTSCYFNARSPHLRCAVNPCGPCEGCFQYRSRTLSI